MLGWESCLGRRGDVGVSGSQDFVPKSRPFLLWPLQNGQCWFLVPPGLRRHLSWLCHSLQDTGPGRLSKVPVSPCDVETAVAGITWVAHCLPPQLHLAPREKSGGLDVIAAVSAPGSHCEVVGAVLGSFFLTMVLLSHQSLVFLLCKVGAIRVPVM